MKSQNRFTYLFGPVPSRRLGLSLGIDVVPHKVCSYDCTYCQIGSTTDKTLVRREYVPFDAVVREFELWLAEDGNADYITFSGAGEPTLYARLGDLVSTVKKRCSIPVAVITNSSLLYRARLRKELEVADLIIPSLDSVNEETFRAVNRPDGGLHFKTMVNGLETFSQEFKGLLYLEIFCLPEVFNNNKNIDTLRSILNRIRYDKIQLNTVVRPPTEKTAVPLSEQRMREIASQLGEKTEIIAAFSSKTGSTSKNISRGDILELLRRHPCSVEDIIAGLQSDKKTVQDLLHDLLQRKDVGIKKVGEKEFYYPEITQ